MTFTGSNASGWSGIRFEPGSGGTLDGVTVQGVAAARPASVVIEDGAAVRLATNTIEGAGGTGTGVRVNGTTALPEFFDNDVDRIVAEGSLTVPAGRTWRFTGSEVRFAPDASLIANGELNATNTILTSDDLGAGWGGLHYEPGSGGILFNTTIDRVRGGNYGSAAVTVTDASPYLRNVTVLNNLPVLGEGNFLAGVRITG